MAGKTESRLRQANDSPAEVPACCAQMHVPGEGSSVGGNLDKWGGTFYLKQRLGGLAGQDSDLPSSPDSGTAFHSVLALLTATAALLLTPTLAAPVESANNSAGKSSSQANTAANYGTPQCKSAMMTDLCISDNARAYCDVTGFHNDFMKSCEGNCFCA
ncbi:hypothetical protein F5144DRAFT_621112 [Chaetomium tenue]|uniref:Uncharacterized protein n=1 Tax=Chaetomium tenue TaxID=1854479 RepID=A0ACB7PBT6_9PEZI|nr:hypothetical protein F5144DRAFT_621112 [Chaetomium globosum]